MIRRRVEAAPRLAPPIVLALVLCVLLSGCGLGSGLYNVSLPGGADVGDHPYRVTAQFADALDLVPQAGVKVNDVAVGRVTRISLEPNGRIADVQVEINGSVQLPANAVASVQQSSLLGEKYVALGPPLNTPATGTLRNGATIVRSRTTDGVEVEQVFGALSLVLNGGGIGQLHDIVHELNRFTVGHEAGIRRFLGSVTSVVTALNTRRASITQALDGLNALARSLRTRNDQITEVLRSFAPGIAVLAGQRKQLITLLTSLNTLSTVTVHTLDAAKTDIVADLQALAPILTQLSAAGSALPRSLQVLATYPFTDGAVAGIRGDYLNAYAQTAFRTPGGELITANVSPSLPAVPGAPASGPSAGTPGLIAPPPALLPATTSSAPGLPSTLTLTPATPATTATTATTAAGGH